MLLQSPHIVIDKTFFLSFLNKIHVIHFIVCFIPLLHTLTFKTLFFNTELNLKEEFTSYALFCYQNDIKIYKKKQHV